MMNDQEDKNSIYKLAQIFQIVYNGRLNNKHETVEGFSRSSLNESLEMSSNYINPKYLIEVIKKDGDINYTVPASDFLTAKQSDSIGNTALHFAAMNGDVNVLELLLTLGADFMIKNRNGMNALHLLFYKNFYQDEHKKNYYPKSIHQFVNQFVDLILSRQISLGKSVNPHDNNGLSHLHVACMTNNVMAVEFFLNNGASVDEAIKLNSSLFPGYTSLHIAARLSHVETAEVLIKYGASVHLKDGNGMTPLHLILEENLSIIHSRKYVHPKQRPKPIENVDKNERIIFLIVTGNDYYTVRNTGLTPLHVACTTSNTEMIERCLKSDDAAVNHAISEDSPFKPGYTALHLAALFNLDTFKFLLKHEHSNMEVRNAKRLTPFEICLEEHTMTSADIRFIMSHHPVWKDAFLSDNTTKLIDLVSAMESPNSFVSFLRNSMSNINAQIAADSSLWPGCTPLHLAMTFYKRIKNYFKSKKSEDTTLCSMIENCLELGGDITIQNAHGSTPLHWAFQFDRIKNAVDLLLKHCDKHLVNLTDENGLSHLHIACTGKNVGLVKKLLSDGANVNHAIINTVEWHKTMDSKRRLQFLPVATTALHIAVGSGCWEITEMLLKHKANIYAKDVYGMTPMHWVFISEDFTGVRKILSFPSYLTECVSKHGLSLLHVAARVWEHRVIKRLLGSGAKVETRITYKPLTTHNSNDPLSFLSNYANFTPLNMNMAFYGLREGKLLVEYGADIAKIIKEDSFRRRKINQFIEDYITTNDKTKTFDPLDWTNYIFSILKKSSIIRKPIQKKTGLTMLHVAGWDANTMAIKGLLKGGANVNAQIHFDSTKWAGFTPMHFLIKSDLKKYYIYFDAYTRCKSDRCSDLHRQLDLSLELLLNAGADVTLSNAKHENPIHLAYKKYCATSECKLWPDAVYRERINILLNHIKDFSVNQVNRIGISNFHIACHMNNISVIKKYLEHQIDVKQHIDYFCLTFAGCTPLHLTLYDKIQDFSSKMHIVDILLRHGAEVNVQNSLGDTPFHITASRGFHRKDLFQILINYGADIFIKNIKGRTPFETLLQSNDATIDDINFFLENGCNVNIFNSDNEEGYLPLALSQHENCYDSEDEERDPTSKNKFELIINSTLTSYDELGRNAIHNLVSQRTSPFSYNGYINIIEKLKGIGHVINGQDKRGRTALHIAAGFLNFYAVRNLLLAGSDFNISDANGKTAFDYALEFPQLKRARFNRGNEKNCTLEYQKFSLEYEGEQKLTIKTFITHVTMLQRLHLDISQRNIHILRKTFGRSSCNIKQINLKNFYDCIEKTKNMKIGSTPLVLYDFLSETGSVSAYPDMKLNEKNSIREFFEMEKRYKLHSELHEVAGLLRLQYGKAIARMALIKKSKDFFSTLAKLPLPDLCSKNIIRYLSNMALQNVIESVTKVSR